MTERLWRSGTASYLRPLCAATGLEQRGLSGRLQRILCDFAWERSFRQSNEQLREHYGFELCAERIRQCALDHAHLLEGQRAGRKAVGAVASEGPEWIIAEADGTMIRLVETAPGGDRRKQRRLEWKEARLAAAVGQGCQQMHYEATLGDVEETGQRWAHAVASAGWAAHSRIHVVSDGAEWIRRQATENLGVRHRFTIDLFHVCEYLAEAAPACARREKPARWLKRHKNMLLKGKLQKVLCNLRLFLEPIAVPEEDAPVRRALRYLENRRECLDYPYAIARQLPVGSGLIEGGHRNVIHPRLKGPGMAWNSANAQAILQARCLRASGQWNTYWEKSSPKAA